MNVGVTIQEKTNSLSWERKEKPTHREKKKRQIFRTEPVFHFREEQREHF